MHSKGERFGYFKREGIKELDSLAQADRATGWGCGRMELNPNSLCFYTKSPDSNKLLWYFLRLGKSEFWSSPYNRILILILADCFHPHPDRKGQMGVFFGFLFFFFPEMERGSSFFFYKSLHNSPKLYYIGFYI